MKKGKKIKPVFPIEYRLLIKPLYKEGEKKHVTFLALRTTNEFTNFRYEIIVEPELNNRKLCLNIRGLRAPQLSIPGSGPATYKTELPNLNGDYELLIIKPGKEENIYNISVTKRQILVGKNPKNKFVDIVTSGDEW
jgi:hypothetical protein